MDVRKIVAEIDAKIASLQQARAVLMDLDESAVILKPRRGRPKGSTNAAKAASVKIAKPTARKRHLSPEGRKRIADAMRHRWAERRKALKKEAAPKKEVSAKKKEATPKK
jgi:hypothetical protein